MRANIPKFLEKYFERSTTKSETDCRKTKKKGKRENCKSNCESLEIGQKGTEFITGQLGGVLVQAIGFNNVTRLGEKDVIGSDVKAEN